MLIKRLEDCPEITANDGCQLRELLHPERDDADIRHSLALAWVRPGEATEPHRLANQTEVYLILDGTGRMHIGDESAEVAAGDTVVIPRGATQWIECTSYETLFFAAIVDPPWRAEDDVCV
ncbi:MAG: cupin domain-containing protein [Planctomycetota bacterium]|jgi:mannose-6-phosphate isomerase-like protein (cupin superfamily)